MLTRVGIKGWKCLEDVVVDLAPFTVLIGPNDSGKSSFLEALWLLRSAPQAVPPLDVSWVVTSGNQPASVVRAWLEGNQLKSRLTLAGKGGDNWESFDALERARAFHPELASISDPVAVDAAEIARPSPIGTGTLGPLIRSRGRGTAAYLAKVALGDRSRHEAIQHAMREVTAGRVAEVLVGEPGGDGYPLSFRLHDGRVIPARDLSRGLLVYLFFLTLVHREDAPKVLLVEEPENGLHPHRIHEVIALLRTLTARDVQIILTTHSPEVLSACQPEDVRVFLRPQKESGTQVHPLPADFRERMMKRDTLGGIWAAEGEEGLLGRPKRASPIARDPAA